MRVWRATCWFSLWEEGRAGVGPLCTLRTPGRKRHCLLSPSPLGDGGGIHPTDTGRSDRGRLEHDPQCFWHQGPVSWKTFLPQPRGWGDGFRMIQVHCIYCALYFYYYYISSPSDPQALDLRGWGPPGWNTDFRIQWNLEEPPPLLTLAYLNLCFRLTHLSPQSFIFVPHITRLVSSFSMLGPPLTELVCYFFQSPLLSTKMDLHA